MKFSRQYYVWYKVVLSQRLLWHTTSSVISLWRAAFFERDAEEGRRREVPTTWCGIGEGERLVVQIVRKGKEAQERERERDKEIGERRRGPFVDAAVALLLSRQR